MRQLKDLGSHKPLLASPQVMSSNASSTDRLISESLGMRDRGGGVKKEIIPALYRLHPGYRSGHKQIKETT